jgi:hypothetical protein
LEKEGRLGLSRQARQAKKEDEVCSFGNFLRRNERWAFEEKGRKRF